MRSLQEIVAVVVRGKIISGAGFSSERLSVANFLDVTKPAGNAPITVRIEGLHARDLDLAVLFDSRLHQAAQAGRGPRWQVQALLEEDLFLMRGAAAARLPAQVTLADLQDEPLILPTGPHGLRSTLDTAFASAGIAPRVVLEVDSLAMVMAAVDAGLGATVQPWAALGRYPDADTRFQCALLTGAPVRRVNLLCNLPDEELSPAALAARVVLLDCVRALVAEGRWSGTRLMAEPPATPAA